jgi:hypothetical protein
MLRGRREGLRMVGRPDRRMDRSAPTPRARACRVSLQALRSPPIQVARQESSDALGSLPAAHRESSDALGSLPAAHRESFGALGSLPAAHRESFGALGSLPAAHRESFDALGSLPAAHRESSDALGSLPAARLESSDALGSLPAAHLESSDALGSLPAAHRESSDALRSLPAAHRESSDALRSLPVAHRESLDAVRSLLMPRALLPSRLPLTIRHIVIVFGKAAEAPTTLTERFLRLFCIPTLSPLCDLCASAASCSRPAENKLATREVMNGQPASRLPALFLVVSQQPA